LARRRRRNPSVPALTPAQREAVFTPGDVCVVAGAGSGKTRVLVERYLAALGGECGEGARPGEILAVTFTERAAREMKERLLRRLAAEGRTAECREVESASVSTIHALCARLLRENPFLAGVVPHFSILDEVAEAAVADRAMDEAFARADGALLDLAAAYGGATVRECTRALLALERARGEGIGRIAALAEDPGADANAWRAACAAGARALRREAAERLVYVASAPLVGKSEEKRVRLAGFAARAAGGEWSGEIAAGLKENSDRLQKLAAEKKAALKEARGFLSRAEELDSFDGAEEAVGAHRASLYRLACALEARLAAHKRGEGKLDYTDLLLRAREVLRRYPELAARCKRRFRYILVDEYQDTNRLQHEILELVARGGNRFLVGDAKQSIYGFRFADVGIFRDVAARLAAAEHGARLVLADNFRSRPEVLRFVDELFSRLWAESSENAHERMTAAASYDAGAAGSRVEVLLTRRAEGEGLEDARFREADAIAERVRALLEDERPRVVPPDGGRPRPVRGGDVAVLTRTRGAFRAIELAFERAGLPCAAAGGRAFFDRRELRDVESVLRLLADPADDAALLAALRAPFCGAGEDAMVALAECARDGEGRLVRGTLLAALERLAAAGEAPDRAKLARFLALRRDLAREAASCTLAEVMESLLERTGFGARLLASRRGRVAYGNVRKLVEKARAFRGSASASVDDFLAYVRRARLEELIESEAAAEAGDEATVRLMTVHGAKGLEFPVVVVADLGRKLVNPAPGSWAVHPEFGLALPRVDDLGNTEPTPHLALAREGVRRREQAEAERLLYVALTRAREFLLLSGVWGAAAGRGAASGDTALGLIARTLEIDPDADEIALAGLTVPIRRGEEFARTHRPLRSLFERLGKRWRPGEAVSNLPRRLAPAAGDRAIARDAVARIRASAGGTAGNAPRQIAATSLAALMHCPACYAAERLAGI